MHASKGLLASLFILVSSISQAQSAPAFPMDQYLIHVFSPWKDSTPEQKNAKRTAPATILFFRANGEYVEHQVVINDDRKGSLPLTVSANEGHTVAVGTWVRKGSEVRVVRTQVTRIMSIVRPGADPLCNSSVVTYRIDAKGLKNERQILFQPTKDLDTRGLASYATQVQSSSIDCAPVTNSTK